MCYYLFWEDSLSFIVAKGVGANLADIESFYAPTRFAQLALVCRKSYSMSNKPLKLLNNPLYELGASWFVIRSHKG
jgi:hypothetical protein